MRNLEIKILLINLTLGKEEDIGCCDEAALEITPLSALGSRSRGRTLSPEGQMGRIKEGRDIIR
jgi:hypothetical protein